MNMLVSIDVKWSMSKHGYKLFDLTFNFDVCLKKKTVPKAVNLFILDYSNEKLVILPI